MAKKELLIPARITPILFQEFAFYDTMGRQKRWRGPAVFALVFTLFAVLSLSRSRAVPGAGFWGGVLLAVGLGLPAVYLGHFFRSVKAQGKKLGGENAPIAYTLRLGEDGIRVEQGSERGSFRWDQLHAAVRLQHSVSLYVTPRQAYLLPGEAEEKGGREIWEWVSEHMPPEKRNDRVKQRT